MKSTRIMMVLVLALAALTACDQKLQAEQQAMQYLSTMSPNARERTVSCMSRDTDGNGYVSCDALVDGRQVTLECATTIGCAFACNSGCKLRPLMQVVQTQGQ